MDKARWGLGKTELPKGVVSVGGRFGYVDDGETANTQICVFDYGDSELIFEVRGLQDRPAQGRSKVGNIFYGSEGYLVCPSYTEAIAFTNDGEVIKKFSGGGDHFANFVEGRPQPQGRGPQRRHPRGPLSSALCHLGNISYRLGREQPFSKKAEAFGDDKEAGRDAGTHGTAPQGQQGPSGRGAIARRPQAEDSTPRRRRSSATRRPTPC